MDTDTKNIMIEIDELPKDIKNIVMDYKEKPITISVSFDMDYMLYGQLFIDIVTENRYQITTNGTLSSYEGGRDDREYKQLSCFFSKKSLKLYILDRLKYRDKDRNEGVDTVDNVNICFVNTKNHGYKNFRGDKYMDEVIELETNSLNKIMEYGDQDDVVTEEDNCKYHLKVMDMLDKYLEMQPDIII